MTTESQPIEQLLDDLDALQKRATDLPYFVGGDTAEDCPEHRHSGLALVDTGRSGDWPVARLCEWPTAEFIAQVLNAYPQLSAALRQRLEREQHLKSKTHELTCGARIEALEFQLRKRIEQEKQSDIEAALNELQEMFINCNALIAIGSHQPVEISIISDLGKWKKVVNAMTLPEAMNTLRQWKEESK